MIHPFESVPRRILLDSCTAQTLRDYGSFIYEGEPIPESDRIRRVPDGIASIEALRDIFLINKRAMFEWIVSRGSLQEAHDKVDPALHAVALGHRRSFRDLPRNWWFDGRK